MLDLHEFHVNLYFIQINLSKAIIYSKKLLNYVKIKILLIN